MEVVLLLSCTMIIVMTINVHGAAIEAPLDVITLHDLSPSDQEYLAYLEEESIRKKRSEDILDLLKSKISQGIKSKIGHIASASSHMSSGKGYHHYGPPPESHDDDKMFDFWDLQKSILNTLLQAAKAIKGGLIAIKGNLIKGSGYIISAKGKLISAKGEAITSMGKHIASSALLSPRPSHHETSGHSGPGHSGPGHSGPGHSGPGHEYGPPSSGGYGSPSGHGVEFLHGPPPSGYSDHKFPSSFEAYKDHLPRGAHHGILILKKIPKGHKDKHNGNDGSHIPPDTHYPDSKPEEPSDPPFTFLPDIKSIFSASSFKEHEEKPSAPPPSEHPYSGYSSDEKPEHHHHDDHDHHHDHEHHHDHDHHHDHEHHHDPDHHHDHGHSHEPSPFPHEPSPTHYESLHSHYDSSPNDYESAASYHGIRPTHYAPQPTSYASPSKGHLNPPATSYGTPISTSNNNLRDYLKDFTNIPISHFTHGLQPTVASPNFNSQMTKLEVYDPLKFPSANPTPLRVSLTDNFPKKIGPDLQGFEHFPTYPVDLSSRSRRTLGKIFSLRNGGLSYAVHEPSQEVPKFPNSAISTSEHELALRSLLSSKVANGMHKFPSSMFIDSDNLKNYLLARSIFQNKQSSHTRSVSRQKRPKSYDLIRSSLLGPNGSEKK